MISIAHLSKSYGSLKVLEDISLQIPKGKMTALIGSNGSGKSTLLSIISRLIAMDAGEVIINEQSLESYKSKKLAQSLSILKQSNQLTLKLKVRELVSFGRFPHSQGKLSAQDEQKIEEAMQYMNLEDIADKYIDELSGGQQQRVYMAMVIAQDTAYILLDEPLNNLDMKHAVQMMQILQRLCHELGKTIIIVIHEINFAAQYADYIVALKDAQILYFDTTDNVIQASKLKEVFDLDFEIITANGKKLCNYFNLNN